MIWPNLPAVGRDFFSIGDPMARSEPLFRVTQGIAKFYLPIKFEIRIQGLENLPGEGPALLIPKHQRWWDVPLLGTYIPRPLFFLAKQELFNLRLTRYYMSRMGGIPLDRQNPLHSLPTFRSLAPLIKAGAFLVVFPEGTYYPDQMGPGKWRLIQMILRLQQKLALAPIPFVPLGIRYETSRSQKTRVVISTGRAVSETDPSRAETFTIQMLHEVKKLTGLK
jgi:1-acyl-sn-glycerol-3-phosphate acyltransferase